MNFAFVLRIWWFMRIGEIKAALIRTCDDVDRNHTLMAVAALSYYFVMALFPALVFLSAFASYLPVPDLFSHGLKLLSYFVLKTAWRSYDAFLLM